jgi:hypothetical protein
MLSFRQPPANTAEKMSTPERKAAPRPQYADDMNDSTIVYFYSIAIYIAI